MTSLPARPVRVLVTAWALALTLSACVKAPTTTPGVGLPVAAASVGAFLESVPPSQRLEWRDLEAGCGDHRDCRRELDQLEQDLRDRCPQAAGCADPVAAMLYVERTAAQRSSGLYPDALPRAGDILAAWQAAVPTPTPPGSAP